MLDFIETHPQLIAIFVCLLPLLVPKVREMVADLFRCVRGFCGARKQDLILEKLGVIQGSIVTIEQEMKFNGGKTIKDMLYLMHSYRRHDYWRIGRPAMELDGAGQVMLVSEMACKLFGVVTPDELKRRSWLRFLKAGTIEDVLAAYIDTVAFQSEFAMHLQIHSATGDERGTWELRASPITREGAENKIYSGYLSPVDDLAGKVAAEIHWAMSPHLGGERLVEPPVNPVLDF